MGGQLAGYGIQRQVRPALTCEAAVHAGVIYMSLRTTVLPKMLSRHLSLLLSPYRAVRSFLAGTDTGLMYKVLKIRCPVSNMAEF